MLKDKEMQDKKNKSTNPNPVPRAGPSVLEVAETTHKKATTAMEALKLTITMKSFELYTRQPLEKILKAKVTCTL